MLNCNYNFIGELSYYKFSFVEAFNRLFLLKYETILSVSLVDKARKSWKYKQVIIIRHLCLDKNDQFIYFTVIE